MEEQWVVDRGHLRELLQTHPEWSHGAYAAELKRSIGWVKKWSKRLCEAAADDEQVLHSLSRIRKRLPEKVASVVVEQVLEIRDHPPEGLQRTPGSKAILYYLG